MFTTVCHNNVIIAITPLNVASGKELKAELLPLFVVVVVVVVQFAEVIETVHKSLLFFGNQYQAQK
jgi:hypothetical protein